MRLRSFILLAPLVALAACNNSGPENDKRSATGEVLQGTTTDAMIPLGHLTSHPPLLPASKTATTPEQAADQDDGDTSAVNASSGAPGEAATPAPTGTPAAAPSTAP